MIDYKTVNLTGDEISVTLSGQNCCIRNLSNEMIYASVHSGIIPDSDGVLGVPAGAVDNLYDTSGPIYLKGVGKVQLAGSNYSNIWLSPRSVGGSGGSDVPSVSDVTEGDVDKLFN